MEYITNGFTADGVQVKVDEGLRLVLPPLQEEEYAFLLDSIRESGIDTPIVLWQSDDPVIHGTIVDGMHRYRAGTELGVPVPYRYLSFQDYAAVTIWMIKYQRSRRNLNKAQIQEIAITLRHAHEERAYDRMVSGLPVPPEERGRSSELASRDLDGIISPRTITRLVAIEHAKAPEVAQLVKSNVIAPSMGSTLTKLAPPVRVEVMRHIDPKASRYDNALILKPILDDIKSKMSAEASRAQVGARVSAEEQVLRESFSRYYDEVVARTPYRVSDLVGQELFYESEATRKAGFMALPTTVMTALLGELSRRADIERCLAMGIAPKTSNTMVTVNQIDTLLLSGVTITETTNVAEEASKITTAKSVADMERKLQSAVKREAGVLSRQEEEEAVEATASRVRVNETMLSALSRAMRLMEDAVADGRVYCPHHGPECKFDMTRLAFECGAGIHQAAVDAKDNIALLAPKTEEVKAMVDVEIRTIGGGRTTDKQLRTKHVRVAGDLGKLYREQP